MNLIFLFSVFALCNIFVVPSGADESSIFVLFYFILFYFQFVSTVIYLSCCQGGW